MGGERDAGWRVYPTCGLAAVKLDRIDIRILSELQKNGRLTNLELADRVNLSASPCLARMKILHTAGFITGFSAQLDLTRMVDVLTVFTEVTLARHRTDDFARFLAAVEKIDQVVECHVISSGYDYLVKFNTCGISQYQELIENLLDLDLGIVKYFSYIVFKTPVRPRQVPVSAMIRSL